MVNKASLVSRVLEVSQGLTDSLVPTVIKDHEGRSDHKGHRVTEGQQDSVERLGLVVPPVRLARRASPAGMVHQVTVEQRVILEQQDSLAEMDRRDLLALWVNRVTPDLLDQLGVLESEEMMDLKDSVAVLDHKVSAAAYVVMSSVMSYTFVTIRISTVSYTHLTLPTIYSV